MNDKNFLILGSKGLPSDTPNMNCESVNELEAEPRSHCDVIVEIKREDNLIDLDQYSSSPELIMKVEPEEDVKKWNVPLLSGRGILDTQPGSSSGTSSYPAATKPRGQEVAPVQGGNMNVLERERLRNVKFSDQENNILVKGIAEHYDKILGKATIGTSSQEKKAIWKDIVSAVNAVSHHNRTVPQCKKRYADIKKKVREKIDKQNRHHALPGMGHRTTVFFWPYEKHMMNLMISKSGLSVNGEVDSPAMTDDEDSAVGYTQTPCDASEVTQTSQESGQQEKEDISEHGPGEIWSGATERCESFSDADQDSQEHGDPSQAAGNLQHTQEGATAHHPGEVTVDRSLRHLSACVKAQTAALRQTNAILRNLSTTMQSGFQQLVNVIQQAVTVMRADSLLPPTSISHTNVSASSHMRGGRPARGRGRHPYNSSPLTRKHRGKQ
ncbi:uncharacterized protein [Hyperolius riggenbachi]|uniref:uncharacterized protein n=1 Tax=Hyperolius riggenbachi TaxID=752182 RepID=UPI0035A3D42E